MPLPIDPEKVLGLIPKEALNKAYDDLLAGPFQEVGKIGTDVAKTARLLLAPLQVTAAFQDRFAGMLKRMAERVPEDRQIEPPAEVVGPVIENMRYLDDRSELWKLYEEMLTRAIDRDKTESIHPAFVSIVKQLTDDEVKIIDAIYRNPAEFVTNFELNQHQKKFFFKSRQNLNLHDLSLRNQAQFELYAQHLIALGMASWPVTKSVPITEGQLQTGSREESTFMLTEFGRLFVEACVPTTVET